MVDFGIIRQRKESNCRTFESRSPPQFDKSVAMFDDIRTGVKITVSNSDVKSFRRTKEGLFKIRVCRKD